MEGRGGSTSSGKQQPQQQLQQQQPVQQIVGAGPQGGCQSVLSIYHVLLRCMVCRAKVVDKLTFGFLFLPCFHSAGRTRELWCKLHLCGLVPQSS